MRRRIRRAALTDDDVRVWRAVTAHIAPLPGRPPVPAPSPEPEPPPAAEPPAKPPVTKREPPPSETKKLPLAPIETRLRQRVARGRLPVDARLDLHGLRQDAAHRRLFAFLAEAQLRGDKLVLIITGKGRENSEPDETGFSPQRGVLRRLTPIWLAEPRARAFVVGFEEAALQHGGSGALYVRIRRLRE
jgi:DNA-nicking Smr family endonuclease